MIRILTEVLVGGGMVGAFGGWLITRWLDNRYHRRRDGPQDGQDHQNGKSR
jgi:hypothetical protein